MPDASKPLSEAVLRRLTNDAVCTFLKEADGYEAAARPGLQLVLSNEPVADMNMLIAGAGADQDHCRDMVSSCLDRQLPSHVMIHPDAGKVLGDIAADLGLVCGGLSDNGAGWLAARAFRESRR